MEFVCMTPQEVKNDHSLIDFIFDTYVDNMYYLFGDDLKFEKSRESWIHYNLDNPDKDFYWRLVIARNDNGKAGFLIYTRKEKTFIVNDIQIIKNLDFVRPFYADYSTPHLIWNKTILKLSRDILRIIILNRRPIFYGMPIKSRKLKEAYTYFYQKDSLFKRFSISSN